MRRLIITADDFGLTGGVSAGIVRGMTEGVVSTTSAMVCRPGAEDIVRQWAPAVAGRIGIHLQLTDGVPCADPATVPSLIAAEGTFPRSREQLRTMTVNPRDVAREWHAQIARLRGWGIDPPHLDTHHHVHRLAGIFDVYCAMARTYGLPARTGPPDMTNRLRQQGVQCADRCETAWYDRLLTRRGLLAIIEWAFAECGGQGTVELMCHPGYADDELGARSSYVAPREQELAVLCQPELRDALRGLNIALVPGIGGAG